ncbi:hypothetical protein L1987_24627 [Smallanthus sonchifolius]|uniref:Uncharacterized protein n=1 Tax=Smallanthus sonchifolius TaxID=185202 RepID=A0ACB9IL59_9ASTR|nr:hypothetical protein L1987_24627 [Smallanthus sonchifolius]
MIVHFPFQHVVVSHLCYAQSKNLPCQFDVFIHHKRNLKHIEILIRDGVCSLLATFSCIEETGRPFQCYLLIDTSLLVKHPVHHYIGQQLLRAVYERGAKLNPGE